REILLAENYSLDNNTTIRQLVLNEKMLNQSLRMQRMNFMPTVALMGSYSFQSLYNNNLKLLDYSWVQSSSVILTVAIPLYRASNFTKIRSSKIQIDQLKENRLYTERQFDMQAKSYIDNMKASTEQMSSNREAIAQAEKGREIAEKRYEVGKGTILELNNSEISLTQAKLIYSQSIYDYLVAKSDLDKVLGKDYDVEKN
ncbi:MAG TPA: TolC family protein, partial [Bacteroidaceae bacterium]|nr:TolC family protein [Bacteroidaceae bacterium]